MDDGESRGKKAQLISMDDLTSKFKSKDKDGGNNIGDVLLKHRRGLVLLDTVLVDHMGNLLNRGTPLPFAGSDSGADDILSEGGC